jgi:drug/metabolite transporter (DMT)-like permease
MHARARTPHASPYLLLTLTVLFWSINWVTGRAIAGHVTPFAFAFIRWVVAVAVMLPFAWGDLKAHWPEIRRNWKMIVWLAFWGTGLHNVFAYAGLQYTTATNGVILNSFVPIMIIVLGWLVYRDTITRVQGLGVVVSMLGVLAILTRGDASVIATLSLNKGDLILIAGMTFWAAYTIFLRMKPAELSGLSFLFSCAIVGLVLLVPVFAYEMLFLDGRVEWTPATMGAMLYVGIFPSFLAYVFWNRAVAEVGPNVAGIFMHLMPVFGTLLAWIFLGERLQGFHLAGIALILGGITLTTRGKRAVQAPAPAPD